MWQFAVQGRDTSGGVQVPARSRNPEVQEVAEEDSPSRSKMRCRENYTSRSSFAAETGNWMTFSDKLMACWAQSFHRRVPRILAGNFRGLEKMPRGGGFSVNPPVPEQRRRQKRKP